MAEVSAKIADGGQVVRDGPVPIKAFIETNATFHLQLHLDQLRALLPRAMRIRIRSGCPGGPP